jgi:hypothetical protein
MADKPPVSDVRRRVAEEYGLHNVNLIALACREADIPFAAACALFEQESGGRNVYGHDEGGTFADYPGEVNKGNWEVFRWLVIDRGAPSNGVGPAQITYAGSRKADGTRSGGFFTQMEAEGLRPYAAYDNMRFGLRLLRKYWAEEGTWEGAGRRYNGASGYGFDLADKVKAWSQRFRDAER